MFPLSDSISRGTLNQVQKRWKHLRNVSVNRSGTKSKCRARDMPQVKSAMYTFFVVAPSLMDNGPAKSTPVHTCQPYRIFRENHGKLTSIPVYRGIYKIYRIFKKSNVPPQAAIVHVRSTLNHVLTRYYHEYLQVTSFLLEISVDLATCRLKACYLNRLPLLCSCGDSDLVGQVMWK